MRTQKSFSFCINRSSFWLANKGFVGNRPTNLTLHWEIWNLPEYTFFTSSRQLSPPHTVYVVLNLLGFEFFDSVGFAVWAFVVSPLGSARRLLLVDSSVGILEKFVFPLSLLFFKKPVWTGIKKKCRLGVKMPDTKNLNTYNH